MVVRSRAPDITDIYQINDRLVGATAVVGCEPAIDTARFTVLDQDTVFTNYTHTDVSDRARTALVTAAGHVKLTRELNHVDFRHVRTAAVVRKQAASRALILTGLGQNHTIRTTNIRIQIKQGGFLRFHAVPFRFEQTNDVETI